jgi:hypothetical protein
MLVAPEEHDGAWVIEFIHGVEIGNLLLHTQREREREKLVFCKVPYKIRSKKYNDMGKWNENRNVFFVCRKTSRESEKSSLPCYPPDR